MDSNPTRARYAQNRKAFVEVLGDPFAAPEVDGHYNLLKQRGTMGSQRYNFDEGHGTANAARPSQIDFFCDVERVISTVITNSILLNNFIQTYIVGDIENNQLSESQRGHLEQRIGHLFRAYKIVPVAHYFTAQRKGAPRDS